MKRINHKMYQRKEIKEYISEILKECKKETDEIKMPLLHKAFNIKDEITGTDKYFTIYVIDYDYTQSWIDHKYEYDNKIKMYKVLFFRHSVLGIENFINTLEPLPLECYQLMNRIVQINIDDLTELYLKREHNSEFPFGMNF